MSVKSRDSPGWWPVISTTWPRFREQAKSATCCVRGSFSRLTIHHGKAGERRTVQRRSTHLLDRGLFRRAHPHEPSTSIDKALVGPPARRSAPEHNDALLQLPLEGSLTKAVNEFVGGHGLRFMASG